MASTMPADKGVAISQNSFQPLIDLIFNVIDRIVRNTGVVICLPYGRGSYVETGKCPAFRNNNAPSSRVKALWLLWSGLRSQVPAR